MKVRILIAILALLITLSHCKQGTAPVPDSDVLTETITIDENRTADVRFTLKSSVETGFIAYPRLSVAQGQDKIVLYGEYKATNEKATLLVKTYTSDLQLKGEKHFNYGQGPGDVGSRNVIAITHDKFLVSENSNRRVSIYDHNWNFLSTHKHHLIGSPFYLYESGRHFITVNREWLQNHYRKYTFTIGTFPGFKRRALYITPPFSLRVKVAGRYKNTIDGPVSYSYFCKNKEVFLLLSDKYKILKFDISGKKLKDIIVDVVKETTDCSRLDEYLKDQNWFKSRGRYTLSDTVNPAATVIPLSKGFIVVRRMDQYSTHCDGTNEGDYFSYQLEYLGKVNVPCFYRILNLAPIVNVINLGYADGYLYLLKETDEDFFIEKWEVKE